MGALGTLQSIIKGVSPHRVTFHFTSSEIRIFGGSSIDMLLSISKSSLFTQFLGTIEARSSDILKLLKECRIFSEIIFLPDKEIAKVLLEENDCTLSITCPIKRTEYKEPLLCEAKILVEIEPEILSSLSIDNAQAVEVFFRDHSLELIINGDVKIEGVQKYPHYLKRESKSSLFLSDTNIFLAASLLSGLSPKKIIFGADKSNCIMYIYFQEITAILYGKGTLM
ncbi:hypothetical protein NEFER03_1691 [Nematocida sp. LUAm3]|nr:hypothetical protein NEFER03_1691 [Nematocida sp. LUAm3]KAI5175681.1 hypothetical protein NEFER02_1568 [Nematocida sp. LUAm2]KAI5178587.1 hypothetical protein NEFER01_1723 [Nematocida sp. LUAm1]